jgi:L-threonylcarbamoyladenylate synthase
METTPASRRLIKAIRAQVRTAVRVLERGGVVALPTETLYGLAASAQSEEAVKRLFRIKGRPRNKPLPLLLADPADISNYALDVPEVAARLVERFFPGPLTLVLRSAGNLPDAVTAGMKTIAVRVPDHWVPRQVVRELGSPITGTSANRSGMPALTSAEAVRMELGGDIDYVVDAGRSTGGVASTIVDVSGATPVVLRVGSVSIQEIEDACGTAVAAVGTR